MNNEERFNNILNDCLDRLVKGETIEQCLQSHQQEAGHLEPLLRTAFIAHKASHIQPRSDFKARVRYDLITECQKMPSRRWSFRWQFNWATSLAVALVVLILSSGGTVAAASNSMPDDALYGVKLASEQARLVMTPSAIQKAALHAELADKRVAEIVYVANKGEPEKVTEVAMQLDNHLEMIAALAEPKNNSNVSTRTFQGIATDTAQSSSGPAMGVAASPEPPEAPAPAALASAPAPTVTSAPAAVPAPSTTAPTAKAAVPAPALAPAQKTPEAASSNAVSTNTKTPSSNTATANNREVKKPSAVTNRSDLKEVVKDFAAKHPAQLNEALANAPSSVKAALRKAIKDSLARYEKALTAIDDESPDK